MTTSFMDRQEFIYSDNIQLCALLIRNCDRMSAKWSSRGPITVEGHQVEENDPEWLQPVIICINSVCAVTRENTSVQSDLLISYDCQ